MSSTFIWNNYIIKNGSIGKGSFSKVYYGYHKDTKLEIALKKILFTSLQSSIKDKVISEITILQKMNHVNIIKLYEYKFDGDYIFLVTEYCKDKDLDKWMKKDHTIEEIINMIEQITNGIYYMHTNHILHRDIKPENILLHNGIVKICDFGFSTIIKENRQMMQTICGTPLFMSPELLFMKAYTINSEIWALGILFYMIIYKIHPFGIPESLSDYRLKIKRHIVFIPINEIDYIVKMIEMMLSYEEDKRPTIDTICQIIKYKNIMILSELPIEIKNEKEEKEEKEKNEEKNEEKEEKEEKERENENREEQLLRRINELEYEIFELEERSEQTSSCCFGREVTGRGRTNNGYELAINNDYFTPPETGISIPKKAISQPCSYQSRSNSGSFLSNSLDKFTSFFSGKK
jgi:serine/threonine protein kinase